MAVSVDILLSDTDPCEVQTRAQISCSELATIKFLCEAGNNTAFVQGGLHIDSSVLCIQQAQMQTVQQN